MKTLVIYYSYTGVTYKAARRLADELKADLVEVQTQRRPNAIGAYVSGSFAAMRQKGALVLPLPNMTGYDKIIIMGPIWAGYPAPAVNNIIAALPAGKQVELRMVSSSGQSRARDVVIERVEKTGCTVTGHMDIKASTVE